MSDGIDTGQWFHDGQEVTVPGLVAELKRTEGDLTVAVSTAVAARSELEALRERVEGLIRGTNGSWLHGGQWQNGMVSVDALCEAVGIAPNGPPPPLTPEQSAEIDAELAAIRAERERSSASGETTAEGTNQ